MQTTPTLSVFIPAFNAELFVREAVESVLDNGFPDIEVIVVDDYSTDATAAIVESIRHPALRLVKHSRNFGIGKTRQHGVSLARGTYLALLDADDIALPGRFEKQVGYLETPDSPDILGGAIEYFGLDRGIRTYPLDDVQIKTKLPFFTSPLANTTVCMKLAPLREGRIRYSEKTAAEDYALWADAFFAGLRFGNLPDVLTRYRRHDQSLTRKIPGDVLAQAILVREKIVAAYFKELSAAKKADLVNALSYLHLDDVELWMKNVYALSHAAVIADNIPHIDPAFMRAQLTEQVLAIIAIAKKRSIINNDILEAMTENDAYFEKWRSYNSGELDMKIMALWDESAHGQGRK